MNAARVWPIAIAGVLGVTVIANVIMYAAATGPDAAVAEPDYYRKAVAWDSTQAVIARAAELGWTADATLGTLDRDGSSVLEVSLARRGEPASATSVQVEAIHNAYSGALVLAQLAPVAVGRYRARLALRHPGRWELRLTVVADGLRIPVVLRREVPAP